MIYAIIWGMIMFDAILIRAMLMLILIGCLTAPLGSIALWKRMSYFGDAASHAALFGVSLSLAFQVSPIWGGLFIAMLVVLYVGGLDQRDQTIDSRLGVLAYGGLAGALLLSSYMGNGNGNLEAFLYGDILSVSQNELWGVLGLVILADGVLFWRWNKILVSVLNSEMAQAQGINVKLEMRIFVFLLSITAAIAMKAVGAILVGALLIIPALTARKFVKTPEMMVGLALIMTWLASAGGIFASYKMDLLTGPAIVVVTFLMYALSRLRQE